MRQSTLSVAIVLGSLAVIGLNPARDPHPSNSVSGSPWLRVGAPQIRTAGALTFTPDGVLLVGDSPASTVFALDVADSTVSRASGDTVNVPDIDQRIAARLGTTVRDMTLNDMAVHPRSHAIYFSVTRGHGAAAAPAIVRVGSDRAINVVPLDRIAFAQAVIPNPPAPGAKNEDGEDAFGMAITGLTVAGGQVYVAGLTNEEFSSQLRRIPLPFTSTISTSRIRFFHSHHSRYETKAPITALAPYTQDGREYLVASYACTPLVVFPLDQLTDGANVTGRTIVELGAGTSARDVVPYQFRGKQYLAISTRHRSLQLLEADSLASAAAIDENTPRPRAPTSSWSTWGKEVLTVAQPGVLHLADFNTDYVAAVQRNPDSGVLTLRPIKKPILWP